MKSKLLKAVEQTVKKYEDYAVGEPRCHTCSFCNTYPDCGNCPVWLLDGGCCNNKGLQRAWTKGSYRADIPSCLAIMVYVWGFENFGSGFIEPAHHMICKNKKPDHLITCKECHKRIHNQKKEV